MNRGEDPLARERGEGETERTTSWKLEFRLTRLSLLLNFYPEPALKITQAETREGPK